MNNWNSYKRKQANITKAIPNGLVCQQMQKNYIELSRLIISKEDKDTFNDTFLKLTYCYNSQQDFVEQFKYYFNLLKGAYYRDDKALKALSVPIDNLEDSQEPEESIEEQIDEDELLQNLIKSIDAISEKTIEK